MSLLQRTTLAMKALTGMQFPAKKQTSGDYLFLPQTGFDYKRVVGDGRSSSIIMGCTHWVCRTFPEAPLRIRQEVIESAPKVLPNHKLELLIEAPNPAYSGVVLWMGTLADLLLTGNAYWFKVRNAYGEVIQLWYTPASLVEPAWEDGLGKPFIDHYDYKPLPSKKALAWPIEDVVHFRYGIDDQNVRKGLSPLASVLREVFTDEEASNFSASLLRNLGIPGVIISPADADSEATTDDLKEVKEDFTRKFSGDRRGEPMVLKTKTDVKILSFSPQQLDLKGLRRLPEERVTAVLGVPAVVVGLGAGLDRSTFANFAEAREAAFESLIAPLQRLVASEVTMQLLPDFDVTTGVKAYFDTRNVRILQEDRGKLSKRTTEEFIGGLISRREGRARLDMNATPADDVYRMPKTMIEVPANEGAVSLTEQLLQSNQPEPAPKKELSDA